MKMNPKWFTRQKYRFGDKLAKRIYRTKIKNTTTLFLVRRKRAPADTGLLIRIILLCTRLQIIIQWQKLYMGTIQPPISDQFIKPRLHTRAFYSGFAIYTELYVNEALVVSRGPANT